MTNNKRCLARTYRGHTNYINHIEISSKENIILTASVSDECIF